MMYGPFEMSDDSLTQHYIEKGVGALLLPVTLVTNVVQTCSAHRQC